MADSLGRPPFPPPADPLIPPEVDAFVWREPGAPVRPRRGVPAVLVAAALGVAEVVDDRGPQASPPIVEAWTPAPPDGEAVTVDLAGGQPEASRAVVRPWLLARSVSLTAP